jgi:hypothetical protein
MAHCGRHEGDVNEGPRVDGAAKEGQKPPNKKRACGASATLTMLSR